MTERDGPELSRRLRVALGLWLLFLLSGFCLAAWLQPNPQGFGTHQQLGLPPCSFRTQFDVPCPSCGMTTSFSCFVRGQWIQSGQASLTGFGLALFCAVQIPWLLVSLRVGRVWRIRRPDIALLIVFALLYGVGLIEWLLRFRHS